MARCSHRDLVNYLGQAGYARYDESTARRLHGLATRVCVELDAQLSALSNGRMDLSAFRRWLLDFEGVDPKTVEILMREAAAALEKLPTSDLPANGFFVEKRPVLVEERHG